MGRLATSENVASQPIPNMDQFTIPHDYQKKKWLPIKPTANDTALVSFATSSQVYVFQVNHPNFREVFKMDPWDLCKQNIPANAERKEHDEIAINQGRVFAIFGIGKKGIGRDKFFMWFVVTCKRYIHFYQISGNGNSPADYIHVYTGVLGKEIVYAKFLSEGVVCIIDEEYTINLFYTEDIFLSYIDKKNLPKVEALGKAFLETQVETVKSIHHTKKNWGKSTSWKLNKLEEILESKFEEETLPQDESTGPNFLLEKRYSLEGPPPTKEIILTSDVVNIVDQNYWLISKKGWIYIKDRTKYLEFHVQGVREYFSDLLERKSYSFC
jgi:hypothetical protein